ncbi:hypothetical protein J7L24_01710 [bacterium]|nr:hypothetical protein [bacterium]
MEPIIKNAEKRKKFCKENPTLTYSELAKVFGHKNGEVTRQWCRRHNASRKRIATRSKRVESSLRNETLVKMLKERARTEHELKRAGIEWKNARRIAKKVEGYNLYVQRNEYNEKTLILIREIGEEIKIKPRAYKFAIQEEQPYIWTQFPYLRNSGGTIDRIRLFPLADFHYGHVACDTKSILQDIEYIKSHKDIYAFLDGDLIENASKLSIASGIYEQNSMPNEQIHDIVRMLAPIAHKIIFSVQGNHEERAYRHLGIDIGEIIAKRLKIPYFSEPVYSDLLWRDYRWTMFVQHGASNAQTKGGKMNAATRPISWLNFTNFIVYAHVHDKISNEIVRIVRDPTNFRLIEKKQYIIVLGAYLKHFRTYGARKGYPPTSKGRVMLKMYSNGKYYVGY